MISEGLLYGVRMRHRIVIEPYEMLYAKSPIHLAASKGLPVRPLTSEVDWRLCKWYSVTNEHSGLIIVEWDDYK